MKHLAKQIPAILLVALFMIAINVYAAPWTGPTAPFPDNNALEPLNKGNNTQTKLGNQAGLNLTALWVDSSVASHIYSIDMTDGHALGYCFGKYMGFAYDPDALGCISSVPGTTQLPGEPGIPADLPDGTSGQTLRHDGTDWLANSILRNNGETVTVRRGSNSQGGGTPSDSESGFLGVKKAFAQTTSNADIFQAIKEIVNGANNVTGSNGLHVTSNGTTWLNGGLLNEGNAYNTGDLKVDGNSILKRTVISGGNLLSGYGSDFQWGGSDGDFWVGTKAEFEGPLKISSGNPGEGKVLTSDAEGNASWNSLSLTTTTPEVIRVSGNTAPGNGSNSGSTATCPSSHPVLIGGGGTCSRDLAYLNDSYPDLVNGQWKASCTTPNLTQNDTIAYALCMAGSSSSQTQGSQGGGGTPPPTGPVWHGYSADIQGQGNQRCLTFFQSILAPAYGATPPANAQSMGIGGNLSGSQPQNIGQCYYDEINGPGLVLQSATYQNPAWRPVVSTYVGYSFWIKY